jgi:acyl-CoA synthetase (AMP-forming)/AMP-acid ligase II
MNHDVLRASPDETDVYLHAGPITHTSGLFILPFLVGGARQILMAKWDPESFVDAVQNRGATHTALVPTMVARLLAKTEFGPETYANLKMLAYAGAPMPTEQVRGAHDRITRNLVQYYGLVEAIPPVTVLNAKDHELGLKASPEILTSAGMPAVGVEMAIVDESGKRVPTGEIGEVITRGSHVMSGYRNAQSRSDLGKSLQDGWLFTGDLGHMDDSGRLWLVDRRGDMIISGGYNIYPREVEDVLARVPGVDEVAVIGAPDADWGQRVVAFYSVAAGYEVDESAVLEFCRDNLASYKKPKEVRHVGSFPVNANGKIAKKVLRAQMDGQP